MFCLPVVSRVCGQFTYKFVVEAPGCWPACLKEHLAYKYPGYVSTWHPYITIHPFTARFSPLLPWQPPVAGDLGPRCELTGPR